jgi:hypothetical protein
MQYHTQRGFLLVNSESVFFEPFHHFVVQVVRLIAESFYTDTSSKNKDNLYLKKWCND